MSAFWSGHVGAAVGCCLRLLLSKLCALERACCCPCMVPVQGAAADCCFSFGAGAGAAQGAA